MTGFPEENRPAGGPEDEAITWFTRLRGEHAEVLKPEFSHWLAASARNREAYARIAAIFEQSVTLKQSERFGAQSRPARRNHVAPWPSLALAAAIAGAALLGLAVLRPHPHPGTMSREASAQPLATGRGEIRTFRLADGSSVTLDTASRAEVVIDHEQRRLSLRAGRARVTVAPGKVPFVVEAGNGAVTSTDGVFDVTFSGDRQQIGVRLVAGSAGIAPLLQSAAFIVPVRPLLPGQAFAYRPDTFGEIAANPTGTMTSDAEWPAGWAEYRAVPLAELVGQANRYAFEPVIIDDRAVGMLSVSGRFHLTDSEALARRLAQVFDLVVAHKPDGFHLARPEKSLADH